jgi:hypothetical protein
MSTSGATLYGFAYGEHLDGLPPRSLGYRLLAPLEPQPWSAEVEALARRLQGAPYPEHWPPTDLFCSVLLADGRRLVAVARYGLADHTPSHRRGGLELIGAVAPGDLEIASALALYRWLQARREQTENLHALGGQFSLGDVLAAVPPSRPPSDPVPVLPVRMWQQGALLFAATVPSDPDHRLALLDQEAGNRWQWLPLVGADFPLAGYAQRGPLVAWTPHLSDVALKVDRRQVEAPAPASRFRTILVSATAGLVVLLVALMGVNLWATLSLPGRVTIVAPGPTPDTHPGGLPPGPTTAPAPPSAADASRERLAEALHDLLQERMGKREWAQAETQLVARYERAIRDHPQLRVEESNQKGKLAIGAVSLLSQRSADRMEEVIRKALVNRGYDPALIDAAAERIRQQLLDDLR